MELLFSLLLGLGFILSVTSFLIVKAQQLVFQRWKVQGLIISTSLEIFGSICVYHWIWSFLSTPYPEEQKGSLSGLDGVFDWLFSGVLILALLILNISNIVSAIAIAYEHFEK